MSTSARESRFGGLGSEGRFGAVENTEQEFHSENWTSVPHVLMPMTLKGFTRTGSRSKTLGTRMTEVTVLDQLRGQEMALVAENRVLEKGWGLF